MPVYGAQPASPNASLIECHGHSLTNGGGLVDPTDRVSAKLAGFIGSAQEVNRSIAGACAAHDDTVTPGGYAWTLQRVQREFRRRQPYEPASNIVELQYGLNDMVIVAASGSVPKTPSTQGLNAYIHAMRTIISRFRAAFVAECNYGTAYQTYTSANGGTWTSTAYAARVANTRGSGAIGSGTHYHKLTGNATQKNGSVISIIIPGDYPGSAVCPLHVGFIADPLLTSGTITSGGTGVAVKTLILDATTCTDTINTPASNNGLVLRFTGSDIPAGNGVSRTLTLTVSNTSAAGSVQFDYWGIEAKQAPVIHAYQITKGNASGSGASLLWSNITDTHLNTWNTAIQNLVNEFRGAGGSNSGNDYYTEYVELDSVIGGAGWNGNVSTITDNPLAIGATTINITGAGAAGLTSPASIDNEIVTFTANSGTQLTGVVRGAWASDAAAHTTGSNIRSINLAALENFSADGVHWAEGAQKQVAAKVWRTSLARVIQDVTVNADRVGPGRVDARIRALPASDQLIPVNALTPIKFNVQDYDTYSGHDPAGPVPGFTLANSVFQILSDGHYRIVVCAAFEYSKAGQFTVNENGLRQLTIYKNATTAIAVGSGAPDGSGVLTPYPIEVVFDGELRNGEYFDVRALQTGGGKSTTLTASMPNSSGSGVTASVTSSTGIFVGDIIRIDDEHMAVTAVPNSTSLTVTRAQQGWGFAAHANAAPVHTGINVKGLPFPMTWISIKQEQRL